MSPFPPLFRPQTLLPNEEEKPASLVRAVEINMTCTPLATAQDFHRIAVKVGERLDVKYNGFHRPILFELPWRLRLAWRRGIAHSCIAISVPSYHKRWHKSKEKVGAKED